LVVILSLFTIIEHMRHRDLVMNNLSLLASHSGKVVESNLRLQMLKSDFGELQAMLDAIGETGSFRVVYLLDTSGRVIFAPEKEGIGTQLDNRQPDCLPCHGLPANERPVSVVLTASDGSPVFRSMHVIENSPECSQCHDPSNRIIGLLMTDIPIAPIEGPLDAHLQENLLWWLGTILMVVLVVNLVISRFLLVRLEKLAAAIKGFGQGSMPPPIKNPSTDEIGQLGAVFNEMAGLVEVRNQEVQALSENLKHQADQRGELVKRLITAQEDERKRVARELHDELGQALTGLSLTAGASQLLIPSQPERARDELSNMQYLIHKTSDQMYDMILSLRPSLLDDMGLASAIHAHAERALKGTGIAFQMDSEGLSRRLPPEVETAVFRTLQEALQNSIRHSAATIIRLTLASEPTFCYAEVKDNGLGFDLASISQDGSNPQGLGLMGMHERMGIVCGSIEILSRPGAGTTVRIRVPLSEAC
jgi:signal transduction histidine kinase